MIGGVVVINVHGDAGNDVLYFRPRGDHVRGGDGCDICYVDVDDDVKECEDERF